jgi:signal transduction histidine kinase
MTRTGPDRPVRRALSVHAISTLLATVAVAVGASLVSTTIAAEAARGNAAVVADTVAHTVVASLSLVDFSAADADPETSALKEIDAFVAAGVVDRVKVWEVDGDEAVVRYSDEPRNVGNRRPLDADLAARLKSGEVVVMEVPDDAEHRLEHGPQGRLEAFIGFRDAAGRAMELELYVPSTAPQTLSGLLAAMIPVAILGPLALGAATFPLALRLARRLAAREAERRELLHTALAASDRERRRLASRLHDGIIQDLASVGLTLDRLGFGAIADDPDKVALLMQATDLLDADLTQLRTLLTELAPPEFEGSLYAALGDLIEDLRTGGVRIVLDPGEPVQADPDVAALLYRVARELIRNAIEHGQPTTVRIALRMDGADVVLDVADDGRGFDPSAPAPEGHLGLSLIRQSVLDSGGVLRVIADTDGARAHVRIPARSRAPGDAPHLDPHWRVEAGHIEA